ncbi:sensor histidine kinase [Bailinhaonella thermotolerans]|uniref:histidine kinase n=1 Tax=Bailinhaonella thermotolerans TaxID=1070861 RepID=A0A3A4BI60_9ACTN|nr:HAMP domain-containing sensor histidine kinase [Bailinhaonella thermotolerans]RJL30932.1 sensor histidine kinase [Bailinhaonella thermotolerans]
MTGRNGSSIRTRATLAAMAVTLAVSAAVAVGLTLARRDHEVREEIERQAAAARRLAFYLREGRFSAESLRDEGGLVQIVNDRGAVVAASSALAGSPALTRERPSDQDNRFDAERCDLTGRRGVCHVVVALRVHAPSGWATIYTLGPAPPAYAGPGWLAAAVAGVTALTALAGLLTSRLVGRPLRWLEAIRRELAEVSPADPGRRVPVPVHDEELAGLAETVNATLDRLQTGLEEQRRFTGDAAHDLQGSLTALRGHIRAAMAHDAGWERAGREMLDCVNHLDSVVGDMLVLSSLGAPGEREPVDLAALVEDEVRRLPRGIRVETDLTPGVVVEGDRGRLARALRDVLDNAVRHASALVTVTLRREGERAVLEVRDDGDGVPFRDRELIFTRFARLVPARERDAGGSGLGLPIAREVAVRHGGTLTAEDCDDGARFVLSLPLERPRSVDEPVA